jgi:iron complex transport system ATP-binding protein
MSDASQKGARPAIAFENLGHCYLPGQWVFRDYSARLERGCIAALLGRNGRGKTTLLRLLLGLLKPTRGEMRVHGRAAFAPQNFQCAFGYSALDVVLMGRARHVGLFSQPTRRDEQAALSALERFGLAEKARQPFQQLSGGQKQLALIARALVSEAEIIVLDEPAAALDMKNQLLALGRIASLARDFGLTVVFTTHHPAHALDIADEAWLMLGENDFVAGAADDVLSEANLTRLYDTPIKRLAFEHQGRRMETILPLMVRESGGPEPMSSSE